MGCATGGQPGNGGTGDDAGAAALDRSVLAGLEGLSFVRDGSVWAVEDGTERLVAERIEPWSLRSSHSGDAVTWVSLDGTRACIETAARGDWRPETLWESDLGSLIAEAFHDDVEDVLWFSVSGEQTSTVGFLDIAHGTEGTLDLPVEAGTSFCLDYDDSTLVVVGASQQPASLFRVSDRPHELFQAAALFTARCSPDGSRVAVTGILQAGAKPKLWVIDMESGAVIEPDAGPAIPTEPAWSRDGRRLAFRDARSGTIWTVLATGGRASDSALRADEGGLAW